MLNSEDAAAVPLEGNTRKGVQRKNLGCTNEVGRVMGLGALPFTGPEDKPKNTPLVHPRPRLDRGTVALHQSEVSKELPRTHTAPRLDFPQ